MEQFSAYRGRVAKTLGDNAEMDIYRGAHGEWIEDPDHKGEFKLVPIYDEAGEYAFMRPWFDETNTNWSKDPMTSYLWLKGVQSHMNNLLELRGHIFLNEVLDALRMPRSREGQVTGWLWGSPNGDNYIDFGFMTGTDPNTVAFRNGMEKTVQLDFNIDGMIWDKI